MIRSVRILGGGRSFSGFTLFNDPDDGGAVDAAAGGRALEQGFSFTEVALDEIGGRLGDVFHSHIAVADAVVVGPDGPEGGVDDELDDEIEGSGVLSDGIDEAEAAEVVLEWLFALAFFVAIAFVAAVAVQHQVFVVVKQADERVIDDFLSGQLRSEAFDEDFLVLVVGKIAVNSDARIDILFLGQDGFN